MALMDHPALFQKAGVGLLFFGNLFLIGLYFLNRKSYLKLQGKGYRADIEQKIVRSLALEYFSKIFQENSHEVDVVIRKGELIEILTKLPRLQEKMLEQIESELSILLKKRLGYHKGILFNFQVV